MSRIEGDKNISSPLLSLDRKEREEKKELDRKDMDDEISSLTEQLQSLKQKREELYGDNNTSLSDRYIGNLPKYVESSFPTVNEISKVIYSVFSYELCDKIIEYNKNKEHKDQIAVYGGFVRDYVSINIGKISVIKDIDFIASNEGDLLKLFENCVSVDRTKKISSNYGFPVNKYRVFLNRNYLTTVIYIDIDIISFDNFKKCHYICDSMVNSLVMTLDDYVDIITNNRFCSDILSIKEKINDDIKKAEIFSLIKDRKMPLQVPDVNLYDDVFRPFIAKLNDEDPDVSKYYLAFLDIIEERHISFKTRGWLTDDLFVLNKHREELKEREEGGDICSICHMVFLSENYINRLNRCNHKFHTSCINRWLKQKMTCPMCRESVDIDEPFI